MEALAIIYACETFRPYLYGSKFVIETDHHSLQWLMRAPSPARHLLVRWALRLAEYDFTIKYKRGDMKENADALSRLPVADENLALTSIVTPPNWFSELNQEQREDPELADIIEQLKQAEGSPNKPFQLRQDLLYFHRYDGRLLLVIPKASISKLLDIYHSHPISEHMSRDLLYALLRKQNYWKCMFSDICKWIEICSRCSSVKAAQPTRNGLLQPIVTTKPFETIAADIIGPLTRSPEGYQCLLNFIDLYTSWPESIPLRTFTAEELSLAFERIIIARHACPDNVLTDRGTNFTSKLFKQICARYKIRHLLSTAYHHQTTGKVERFHKFM
jgi:hypothetical protein